MPRDLAVRRIPPAVPADLLIHRHDLHAAPAGMKLTLGVFAAARLAGAIAFHAGQINAHRLVRSAVRADGTCLRHL